MSCMCCIDSRPRLACVVRGERARAHAACSWFHPIRAEPTSVLRISVACGPDYTAVFSPSPRADHDLPGQEGKKQASQYEHATVLVFWRLAVVDASAVKVMDCLLCHLHMPCPLEILKLLRVPAAPKRTVAPHGASGWPVEAAETQRPSAAPRSWLMNDGLDSS